MLRKKKSPFRATFSQGYEKKNIYIYDNIYIYIYIYIYDNNDNYNNNSNKSPFLGK